MIRCPEILGVVVMSALIGCTRNDSPSGPRRVLLPSYAFSAGQVLSFWQQNFDQNHNPVSSFQHDAEVLATGGMIGGLADAATLGVGFLARSAICRSGLWPRRTVKGCSSVS